MKAVPSLPEIVRLSPGFESTPPTTSVCGGASNTAVRVTKFVELPWNTKCQPQVPGKFVVLLGHDPVPKPGLVEPTWAVFKVAFPVAVATTSDSTVGEPRSSAPATLASTTSASPVIIAAAANRRATPRVPRIRPSETHDPAVVRQGT